MRRRVLLYCDGGRIAEIGTGHVRRCLLLARYLKTRGSEVAFLTSSGAAVVVPVSGEGFECEVLPALRPADLARALKKTRPEVVVWDRLDSSPALNRVIRNSGAVLITLDDAGKGQTLADITINAMVPGGLTPYKGFDYAMLPAPPEAARTDRSAPVRRITVCFGGYDHEGLSEAALKALTPLDRKIKIDLILGSASSEPSVKTVALHGSRLRVLRMPHDFSRLLSRSDVAVLAGGATLIEALSYGVPTLAIGQYGHQLDTIARCEAAGAVIGVASTGSLLKAVRALAANSTLRVELSRSARRLVDGQGLKRVADLTTIVEQLPWDTEFFGENIATLHPARLNETLADHALAKCRKAKIDCLYYRCDCHDPVSVVLAERHGFHFVDIRMTFSRAIEASKRTPLKGYAIRPARRSDVAQLKKIAAGSYIYSRYFFDRRFPDAICAKFYANWIEKSVRGYSDAVLVAAKGSKVLGYISCSMRAGSKAGIDLVSVAPGAEGAGVGKALVRASLDWADARGAAVMEVVTQGRNYAAQRLYQGSGFKTQKLELWYHKWFAK
ncbi:MAG: GNAT family N-acetyltransferase [Elusimicrobia bacterium]|nr:GNAT family N-acetyltransferase [Elusimicrobiota bacterium]